MAKFLKRSEYIRESHYLRIFRWRNGLAQWGFPCDKAGTLLNADQVPAYQKALATPDLLDNGIEELHHNYHEPAVIECDRCQRPVSLDDAMTNACDCGELYNGSGQHLCHPSHWGEETGERFDDNGHQIL